MWDRDLHYLGAYDGPLDALGRPHGDGTWAAHTLDESGEVSVYDGWTYEVQR